jgi:hypothetical protein
VLILGTSGSSSSMRLLELGFLGDSMLVVLFHAFGVVSCGLTARFWYLLVRN